MKAWTLIIGGALLLSSTAMAADMPVPTKAKAVLYDAKGQKVGEAKLIEGPYGVLITLEAQGLPPGKHAFHIHDKGDCHAGHGDGGHFTAAGGHFNPDGKQHGYMNPKGPHAGDLPNIFVGKDGKVAVEVIAPMVTLKPGKSSLLKEGGTSLMIHAGADDYKSDPAGNAGARIACGKVEAAK